MAHRSPAPKDPMNLRVRAASRLTAGISEKGAHASAADALAILHDLASSPATAADALALLHELQVHQVELDLQAEELRESRAELESALQRQIELYDHQPVGCFTLDHRGELHELNLTGAAMLGIERADAYGLPLEGFVAPASVPVLRALVAGFAGGRAPAAPTLQLATQGAVPRTVRAHVRADPAGQLLLVLADEPAGD